jgi:hypothetical protein
MRCRGAAIGTAGAIRMTDTTSPTGAAMCHMTCIALEPETAVENIPKRRADAERRRAELQIAKIVVPWWRRWFRW